MSSVLLFLFNLGRLFVQHWALRSVLLWTLPSRSTCHSFFIKPLTLLLFSQYTHHVKVDFYGHDERQSAYPCEIGGVSLSHFKNVVKSIPFICTRVMQCFCPKHPQPPIQSHLSNTQESNQIYSYKTPICSSPYDPPNYDPYNARQRRAL